MADLPRDAPRLPPWAFFVFIVVSAMNVILLLVLITIFSGAKPREVASKTYDFTPLELLMGQLTVIQTFMTAFGVAIAVMGLLAFWQLRRTVSDISRQTVMEMADILRPGDEDPIQQPDLTGLKRDAVKRKKAAKE